MEKLRSDADNFEATIEQTKRGQDETVACLNGCISELQSQLEQLNVERCRLEARSAQVEELSTENNDLQERIIFLMAETASVVATRDELDAVNREIKQKIVSLEDEARILKNENLAMQEKLHSAAGEAALLSQLKEESSMTELRLQSLREHYEEVQKEVESKLKASEAQVEQLSSEKTDLIGQHESMRSELQAHKETAARAESAKESLEVTNEQITKKIVALEHQIGGLMEEKLSLETRHFADVDALKKFEEHSKTANSQLEQHKAVMEDMRSKLSEAEAEISSHKASLIKQLQGCQSEAALVEAARNELEEDKRKLQEQVADLDQQVRAHSEENLTLQERLQISTAGTENLKSELDKLQEKYQQVDDMVSQLLLDNESKSSEVRSQKDQLEQMSVQIAGLEDLVATKNAEISNLTDALKNAETEGERLSEAKRLLEVKIVEMEARLRAAESCSDQANTERKELVGQLESTRAASDKNEKELQQLRLQAASFANDITVVEKQVEELQMELSASNDAKSKLEDTIEALQSEQQQIVHQCTEMIEDAASLQGLIL